MATRTIPNTDSPLAQVAPTGTSLTDVYTVPTGNKYISAIYIANFDSVDRVGTVKIAVTGAADANKDYWAVVTVVANAAPVEVPVGLRLPAGAIIRVKSAAANALAFTVVGIY